MGGDRNRRRLRARGRRQIALHRASRRGRREELSPFLRSLRCPEVRLDQAGEIDALIADIYGISRKPERGAAPRYVKPAPEGLKGWSPAAAAVAEHLVRTSKLGRKFDPQAAVASVAEATGLPEEDVRIGVLDLSDSGLVERSRELAQHRGLLADQ